MKAYLKVLEFFRWKKHQRKMLNKNKHASIYKSKTELIFHTRSRTKQGIYIATEPYLRISINSPPETISLSINKVLAAYKENIPYSMDFKKEDKEYLNGLGFNSFQDLQKNVILVSLTYKANDLIFTPMKKNGVKKGFNFIDDEKITISLLSDPLQITEALNLAFSKCS